jgi:UDP-2-acetamido-3-amino-2,3-dideoxy-glucuronate N-acetyltransferase
MNNIFVHHTAVVDNGATIGEGTKIWHWTHVCERAVIGIRCVLGQNVFVGNGAVICNNVKIQNNVSVYDGVFIEDNVFCGPSMVFTNVLNPRAFIERKDEYKPTRVCVGAAIGANATIICGITLGAYCLVGAGAVVTEDVKPHALIVGLPGKQVGWVSHAGEVLKDDLICPREGRRYQVSEHGDLLEIKGG